MLYGIDVVGCSDKGHTLGQLGFLPCGWGYYPTSCGKAHKARATASTPGHRPFLPLGSAARDARDAKLGGGFLRHLRHLRHWLSVPYLHQPLPVAAVAAERQSLFPQLFFGAIHQLLQPFGF